VAAAIGALVLLPSLAGDITLDDFIHRLHARGFPVMGPARPFDMFRFMDGVPAHVAALRERGFVPWFTADDLRIAFFRPLASLLHTVDYAVLRLPPWAMHAESVAWYALLVFCVAKLYARLLPSRGIAGLAALFYAVDAGHALPAGWLANRNAVLASVFGVLAILAHDRWRRDGWKPGAVASAGCFALALAGGEMAIGTLAYAVAYALTLEQGPWRRRASSLAPMMLVAALWQAAYRLGDYGVRSSGFYVDPGTAPGTFLRNLPMHAAELAMGELTLFPVETGARAHVAVGLAVLGALVLALFVRAILPIVRRDAGARFLAVGAALALVPVCGVMPAGRVLMLVSVGALGVLATLVGDVVAGVETRRDARALARVSGGLHVVLAPVLLVVIALAPRGITRFFEASGPGLPQPYELAGTSVVIVRTPSSLGAAYRFGVPHDEPPTLPGALRLMAVGMGDCQVTRVDDLTLLVRIDDGLLNDPLVALYRDTPVRKGEQYRLSDMTIDVTDDTGGEARAATFRFDTALEGPRRTWVAWDGGRFVRFTPPPVGQTVTLRN
jgi:hypothetical protein